MLDTRSEKRKRVQDIRDTDTPSKLLVHTVTQRGRDTRPRDNPQEGYRCTLGQFVRRHKLYIHIATLGLPSRLDQPLQHLQY